MLKRRRFKQTSTLKERLLAFANDAREKATTAVGLERDVLIKKARRADTAAHIDEWVNSVGLRPPK